jgi:hypothetical protein
MQQKRNHHKRIERRLAEPTHIAARDRLEIQALPHQPNDKPRDVVLSLNQARWDLNSDYSDRLLVLLCQNF